MESVRNAARVVTEMKAQKKKKKKMQRRASVQQRKSWTNDPVEKRAKTCVSGNGFSGRHGRKRKDSVRPVYRAVIGFLTFCLSVAL